VPNTLEPNLQQGLIAPIRAAGAVGLAPQQLAALQPHVSRSTLNRQLAALAANGAIAAKGTGRNTRYISSTPFTRADIDAYFSIPWQQRPSAPFNETLLDSAPTLEAGRAERCTLIQAIAQPIDKRFLASFLIDWSWGSSVLEGGTYSALDTEALVQYGQRNLSKPTADAVLVLNHKRAAEYLWANRALTTQHVCAMHALLTDDSDHFLPEHQRGKPREFEEVNLATSAYMPPFRPGTQYIARALAQIIDTANSLHPIQAALYLMTRIPYLQAFANGNKRTSRLAANAPLLGAGLLPFSFSDVDKADYIRGMAAFYELGSMHVIEQTFINGYVKSVVRSSNIPAAMRTLGFDVEAVARALVEFVNTGRRPVDPRALVFLV
jgi:Fic/DOC family